VPETGTFTTEDRWMDGVAIGANQNPLPLPTILCPEEKEIARRAVIDYQ
jgi:hypothetical protein